MKFFLKNLFFVIMLYWSKYSQGFMIKNESILSDSNYFSKIKLLRCDLFDDNYKKLLLNRYVYFNINNKYYALENEEGSERSRKILFDLEKINNSIIFEYLGCEQSDNSLTFRIKVNHSDTPSKLDMPYDIKKVKDFYHIEHTDDKFHLNLQDITFFVPEEGNFIKSMGLKNVEVVTYIKTCKDFNEYTNYYGYEEFQRSIYKVKSLGSYFKNFWKDHKALVKSYDYLSKAQSFMWLEQLNYEDKMLYATCRKNNLIFEIEKVSSQIEFRISKVPLEDIVFYKYKSSIKLLDEIKDHLVKEIHSCEEFEEYIKAHVDENFIYFSLFSSPTRLLNYALLKTKYNNNDEEFSLVEKPYLFGYHRGNTYIGKIGGKYYNRCDYPNLLFDSIYGHTSDYDLRKLRFLEHKLDDDSRPDSTHSPKIEYGIHMHPNYFEMKELHGKIKN